MDIEADLEQTLDHIHNLTASCVKPSRERLGEVATLLVDFVTRHQEQLTFEHFPEPSGSDEALCSYELHSDEKTGLTLYLNAIRGGVDSVIHDHATWAVIVGIAGRERNRIYREASATPGKLSLEQETVVSQDQSLVLEAELFHSIHTNPGEPALQLHLYGQPIDRIGGRRLVDPQSLTIK